MTVSIPLMDPGRAYRVYREEIDAAVHNVLAQGVYIFGPAVESFERSFAEWCGVKGAVAVANGTDALELALRTLGVGVGDAVFTVSHTAVATVAAIELAGATPVLVDVDPKTYTIDLEKLESTLDWAARHPSIGRPRAVVAVHIYGHPCDVGALRAICDRRDLLLIEDCAQAHGAAFNGMRVGARSDAAAFSFYPTKNLPAFGDGGAVCFNATDNLERCRALREYGWRERYISEFPGMNSRLDELQAAILNVRLRHLDEEVTSRREVARVYGERLAGVVDVPSVAEGCEHAYHLFVVRASERDSLRDHLLERGIGTGIHYPVPVHQQPAYVGRTPLGAGGMPVTETLKGEILSLPVIPFMSPQELDVVCSAIVEWAGRQ